MTILVPLGGRLRGIDFDIPRLQKFFLDNVLAVPATPYKDNNLNYDGWAVTSRTGSTSDNIRRPRKGQDHPPTRTEPRSRPRLRVILPQWRRW